MAEALNAEPADVVVEYLLSAMSPAAVDEATAALAARYLVPRASVWKSAGGA
ncbi:hypothetical protein HS125_04750 [bacterium]|nr:hypothetical protein [bacterium]